MADYTFNTPEGETIGRDRMVSYLNTGTSEAPVWSAFGKRVETSDTEMDWSKDTIQDILGNTWTTMKKPKMTQPFDPIPLDAGDPAAVKLWNLGVKDQNAQALSNMDVMIAHYYTNGANSLHFAERYSGCAIDITRIGGDGGGNLTFSTEITYGGIRTIGTATEGSKPTFTPESSDS